MNGAVRFVVTHGAATVVTAAAVQALLVALYVALLLWAMFTDSGLGSPATLPLILLVALVLTIAVALAIVLPVTVAATRIRGRRNLHYLYEIPIAALLLVIYILVVAAGIALWNHGSLAIASWYASAVALALLPMLGLYWCCLQSAGWLLAGARRTVDVLRRSRRDGAADDERVLPF